MYQCIDCECKYPKYYKQCPSCGSTKKEKEKFKEVIAEDVIKDGALVVMSNIEDFGNE